MPIRRRGPGREPAFQEWPGGLTWVAHPDEAMRRGSHAVAVRLLPPRRAFGGLEVDRVLVGHGDAVLEDAQAALDDALANAYRGIPASVAANPGYLLRAGFVAWRT